MFARPTATLQSVTPKHERDPQASASRVIKVCGEVPCCKTLLNEANLSEIFKSICGGTEPTDSSRRDLLFGRRVVQPYGQRALKHALVSAVHTAWVGNYPLVLTPDVIWTAIQQGQARDSSFVPPSALGLGKKHQNDTIGLGQKRCIDATGAYRLGRFQSFTKKLKEADPSTCTPSFSTSGEQEKAVAQLSLMNAHNYDYTYVHAYGIPTITLTGTKDDWTLLRDSALALASKCTNAPEWSEVLKPVLNQFISAASGEVDQKFWKSIYHCYGDKTYSKFTSSGWIFAFLPFLQDRIWGTYTPCVSKYLEGLKDQASGSATPTAEGPSISYVLQPENSIRRWLLRMRRPHLPSLYRTTHYTSPAHPSTRCRTRE